MSRFRSSRVVLLLAALVTGACGGGDVEAHTSGAEVGGTSARGTEAVEVAGRGGRDEFQVTVDGPPRQGTHRHTGDMMCMMFGGIWQAGFEVPDASGISQMIVQLKEVPAAGGSTDQLMLSVVFGRDDANLALVEVHGAEYGRDGRGQITRDGDGAVIRVEGTTHTGARVTADLRCASVQMM